MMFFPFNNVKFFSLIFYSSNALIDMVEILCSREKVSLKINWSLKSSVGVARSGCGVMGS